MKVTCLVSGGKDSIFALWCALHQFEVISIINIRPNTSDSFLFHIPNTQYVSLIAKMLNLPLLEVNTDFSNVNEETSMLTKTFIDSGADAIIIGGIRSEFQRYRFNYAALQANMYCLNPLWRLSPRTYMEELLNNNFHIILVSVSAMGFGKDLLGEKLTLERLGTLMSLKGVSELAMTGEGGEYESFVLDAPFFPSRIVVKESKVHWNEYREEGSYEIVEAVLEPKRSRT
ncbi:MAG: Dph6-related ATP pyrophosphatase [Candidatus Hodarchaeales archaeon]